MFSKASHSARHVFLMSAAVALLIGGLARTAAAKECTTDLDCDTGYQCVLGYAVSGTGSTGSGVVSATPGTAGVAPAGGATSIGTGAATGSAGDGTGGAGGSVANPCPAGTNCATTATPPSKPPVPATDAGAAPDVKPLPPTPVPTPEPVPMPTTGVCEPKPIVCTSVADCPSADFDCVPDVMPTIAPTCPADTKCPTPPPQTSTTGTCNPKVHACSAATDCPAPLTCQAEGATCSGGASVGPDGTITTMPDTCPPGPSVCTWAPVNCTTDADCADPLYQCVKVAEYGWGSSSGGTCAPGTTCPAPETTSGTTVVMNCMPKPMNCACGPCPAGAMCGACLTCPAGWSCFDFSNYNCGVRPNWSPNAPDKSCLPDGIVFATQGHASDGGQFAATSCVARGGTMAAVGGAPTGTDVKNGTSTTVVSGPGGATPPSVSPVAPTQNTGNGNAAGGSAATTQSSGCAYGGSEASPISLWLALAMTGLVARLARRRRG